MKIGCLRRKDIRNAWEFAQASNFVLDVDTRYMGRTAFTLNFFQQQREKSPNTVIFIIMNHSITKTQ